MIEAKKLSKTYGSLAVLNGVDLQVKTKEIVTITGPSGAGKTSIVHYLLEKIPFLEFSISACSRKKRIDETNGKDYHFLGIDGFKQKIEETHESINDKNAASE